MGNSAELDKVPHCNSGHETLESLQGLRTTEHKATNLRMPLWKSYQLRANDELRA